MTGVIKVVNPAVAKELAEAGFTYIKENIQGTEVLVFWRTPDLESHLRTKFSTGDYVVDNKLSF